MLTVVLEAPEDVVRPGQPVEDDFDPPWHVHLDVVVLLQTGKGQDAISSY